MPKKIGPRLQPLLKNVDYAALRSQAQQIQKEGDDIIMEIRKISADTKCSGKMVQHRVYWIHECHRLEKKRAKLERELQNFVVNSNSDILLVNNWENIVNAEFEFDVDKQVLEEVEKLDEARQLAFLIDRDDIPSTRVLQNGLYKIQFNIKDKLSTLEFEEKNIVSELKGSEGLLETPRSNIIYNDEIEPDEELPTMDEEIKRGLIEELIKFQNQIDETNSEFNYKSGSTSKSGGWNPEDQFHFVKIYTEYSLNSSEGGTWRSLCVQRIQMEMTHITKKEIEYSLFLNKKKALRKVWTQERQEFVAASKFILVVKEMKFYNKISKDAAYFIVNKHQKEAQLAREEEERLKKVSLVSAWKEDKLLNLRDQQLRAEMALMSTLHIRQKNEEKKKKKVMEKKSRVLQFKEDHLKAELETEERAKKVQREEEQLRKLNLLNNKERVERRTNQWRESLREKKRRENERIEKENMKKHQLDLLARTVEPNVQSDPERLYQTTAAFTSLISGTQESNLFQIQSYSEDQILSDKRIKLEKALVSAGLKDTQYGKFILANAIGRAYRIENLTSEQLERKQRTNSIFPM